MAREPWLESSLRRSARLGLEVLERASRRSVDWTSTSGSWTPTTTDEDPQVPVKKTHTELHDAFATIAEFMAQTTYQCKKFYESGCCTEPTDHERKHVSRFHTRPAAGKAAPATRKHARGSGAGEDAITADTPESQQQTQVVGVRAGESISVTFDL